MFTVFCWTLTGHASALPSAHTEILATVQAGPYTKSNCLDGNVKCVEIRFPAPSSPVALCWGDVTVQCGPQRDLTITETSVLGNIISPLCQQGAHAPDPHFRVCTPKNLSRSFSLDRVHWGLSGNKLQAHRCCRPRLAEAVATALPASASASPGPGVTVGNAVLPCKVPLGVLFLFASVPCVA